MRVKLDVVLSCVLAGAAVAVAGAVVHGEFFANASRPVAVKPAAVRAQEWTSMLRAGVTVGSDKAPVKIVEFADFECVECRELEGTLRAVRRRFGDTVAIVFVDYPSLRHRFARAAAQAAECADQQGRFASFHDAVFAKQDSIGLKAWAAYAAESGVPDTARWSRCASDAHEPQRITDASELGIKLRVVAPTIVVNGWRFFQIPTDSALVAAVAAILKGGKPL